MYSPLEDDDVSSLPLTQIRKASICESQVQIKFYEDNGEEEMEYTETEEKKKEVVKEDTDIKKENIASTEKKSPPSKDKKI